MSSEVAIALVRPPVEPGVNRSASMAALMQSNNERVAVSNPLSGASSSILSSPEPVPFLKPQSKPETSLSSIASAGLNVTRSRDQKPQMTSPATPADQPAEPERQGERDSSQVAREALGASEKSPMREPSVHASPEQMQVDSHANDSSDLQNSLMQTSTVASPGLIEESASQDGDRPRPREGSEIDQDSNKAFSYPMPTGGISDPRRGLSLPNSGYNRGTPRSPSAKKHRCPYCATEFTRQHNLKSHLLTHSQEKPFVCQTCTSRFRRLHDLKRHSKLHTGERPHICPKCGRRFARGDALARHNKGQGGCAGRRSSMGSFAPEDEYGDGAAGGAEDAMDGLVYAEPERMDEEDERRLNMPSIRTHDAERLPRSDSLHPRQPSTYPPIAAGRSGPGGLFPPATNHGGSGASTATSQPGNLTFPPAGHPSGTSIFPPSSVGSPKPLSPNALSSRHESGAQQHRTHSPGMQPLPHPPSSFGRTGQSNHGLGLPPPQAGAPQLPLPPGMSSPDTRFGLQANKHNASHSHSSTHSLSAHGPEANSGDDKVWAYIRSMQDEITALRAEVASLRAHIASTNTSAGPSATAPAPVEVNTTKAGPR